MSASASVFNAQFKGVDNATGAVKAITSSVARLIESTRGLTQATKGLTKANAEGAAAHTRFIASLSGHVRLLHGHLGTVNAGIAGIRNSVAQLLPMIATLGAGASLAGLFALVHSTAESQHEHERLIKTLGVSAAQLGGLNYAAKLAAVPTETLTGGIEKFNKALGSTLVGKNKAAAALFNHLGISLTGVRKGTQNAADLFPKLADAIAKTKSPALQAYMATTLLGRAGQELLPILKQGGDALRDQAAEGAKLIYVATPEQKKALREFQDNWIGLEIAISAFKKQVGSSLAPIFAPIVKEAKEWVTANRAWIAQAIHDKVRMLAEALRKLDLHHIIEETTGWVRATFDLINSLGGLKMVLGAVALFMGSPLIGAIAGVVAIFASLGRAFLALVSIFRANPILLGILAIAAGAYLLWKYWDAIPGIFRSIMAGLKQAFTTPIEFIGGKIDQLGTWAGDLIKAWAPVGTFFGDLLRGIRDKFDDFSSSVKPIIEKLSDPLGLSRFVPSIPKMPTIPRSAVPSMPSSDDAAGQPERHGMLEMPPSLYRDDGPLRGSGGAGSVSGQVGVKVSFDNMPRGARASASGDGAARIDQIDFGYTSPMPA